MVITPYISDNYLTHQLTGKSKVK